MVLDNTHRWTPAYAGVTDREGMIDCNIYMVESIFSVLFEKNASVLFIYSKKVKKMIKRTESLDYKEVSNE